jgi:hypothetical protein
MPVESTGATFRERELLAASSSEVASRLLARAEAQHRGELPPAKRVRSGLAALDQSAPSWWGLGLLTGASRCGKTTLAARIALETARAGGRVLWFAMDGHGDTPIFRLLSGLARVPARSFFVDRQLSPEQWSAVAEAAKQVSALPMVVVEAHAATEAELLAAHARAAEAGPFDLVVFDNLAGASRQLLAALEKFADEQDLAALVVLGSPGTPGADSAADLQALDPPQRPGSLQLHLQKLGPSEGDQQAEVAPLLLEVHRAGEGLKRSIELRMLVPCRWIEEGTEAEGPPLAG